VIKQLKKRFKATWPIPNQGVKNQIQHKEKFKPKSDITIVKINLTC